MNTLLLLLLLLPNIENGCGAESLILWRKDRNLRVSDFKGIAPETELSKGAMTYYSIRIKGEIVDGLPQIEVYCFFDKSTSWLNNASSLPHEQIHFDMAEVYVRKMRKGLDSLETAGDTEVKNYKALISEIQDQLERRQEIYDRQCGIKTVNQKFYHLEKLWRDSLNTELLALERYYRPDCIK